MEAFLAFLILIVITFGAFIMLIGIYWISQYMANVNSKKPEKNRSLNQEKYINGISKMLRDTLKDIDTIDEYTEHPCNGIKDPKISDIKGN